MENEDIRPGQANEPEVNPEAVYDVQLLRATTYKGQRYTPARRFDAKGSVLIEIKDDVYGYREKAG